MRTTRFLLSLVLVVFVSNALAAKPVNETAVCHIGSKEGPGGETYDPNCVPTLENNYFCADAGKVDLITVPDVENTAVRWSVDSAAIRSVTVSPVASVICEAIVRFQMSSYSRN